jgi:hypothetical protein
MESINEKLQVKQINYELMALVMCELKNYPKYNRMNFCMLIQC